MTQKQSLPDGLHTVTPYFTVNDADLFIGFVMSVFDAALVKENRYPNNRLQHARLKIGDSIIMINDSSDDYAAQVSQMHVFVDDCEAVYAQALEQGATSIMAPNMRPHGDRMAGFTDPCDNIWWVAKRL